MGLILRPASMADSDLLYGWRVRDERDSPWWDGIPVTRERHAFWMAERVHNPAVRLWIAELDGVPVGDARVDSNGEVTFNTLPEFRRRGLGTKILVAATALAAEDGWGRVKASVDDANVASVRTLERAGYRHHPDVLFFRWPQ